MLFRSAASSMWMGQGSLRLPYSSISSRSQLHSRPRCTDPTSRSSKKRVAMRYLQRKFNWCAVTARKMGQPHFIFPARDATTSNAAMRWSDHNDNTPLRRRCRGPIQLRRAAGGSKASGRGSTESVFVDQQIARREAAEHNQVNRSDLLQRSTNRRDGKRRCEFDGIAIDARADTWESQ